MCIGALELKNQNKAIRDLIKHSILTKKHLSYIIFLNFDIFIHRTVQTITQ